MVHMQSQRNVVIDLDNIFSTFRDLWFPIPANRNASPHQWRVNSAPFILVDVLPD